jgi:hypothetical protein
VINTPFAKVQWFLQEWDCLLMVTKAIVEMQFADFVSHSMNVNLLAKSHYRWLEKQML